MGFGDTLCHFWGGGGGGGGGSHVRGRRGSLNPTGKFSTIQIHVTNLSVGYRYGEVSGVVFNK